MRRKRSSKWRDMEGSISRPKARDKKSIPPSASPKILSKGLKFRRIIFALSQAGFAALNLDELRKRLGRKNFIRIFVAYDNEFPKYLLLLPLLNQGQSRYLSKHKTPTALQFEGPFFFDHHETPELPYLSLLLPPDRRTGRSVVFSHMSHLTN